MQIFNLAYLHFQENQTKAFNSGTGDVNENLDFSIEKTTIGTNVSGFTAIADWAFNYFQQKKTGVMGVASRNGLKRALRIFNL
ncbi:MAG: hypothetical protein ABI288_04380 [Ginsengibacter sp.]